MATSKSGTDPFAINSDGSAKDANAFLQALRADSEKMKALEAEPEALKVVRGDSIADFQELLRTVYSTEKKRQERAGSKLAERTIDAQRASAPVPRDTVQLYAQLREVARSKPEVAAAGEWEAAGDDRFYSRRELYSFSWTSQTLPSLRIACAKAGGPVASTRDEGQVVVVTGASLRPVVKIHSASGRLLAAFAWERGPVAGLGWSRDEELVIIEASGEVSLYDQKGARLPRQFSFGEECQRAGILDCCIFEDGLVALTTAFSLWSIAGTREPRVQRLAATSLSAAPSCMAVIPPAQTISGAVEVLLGVEDGILVVDAESETAAATGRGRVRLLAASPDGQYVAAVGDDGRLSVWLSDFTKNLTEFTTEADTPPSALAWCGTDCVAMAWPDILLLVGAQGDWVRFDLDEEVVLVQEMDGVTLLSKEHRQFLQRVPQSLVEVFRIGSTAPGALLFDARALYEQQSPRADELLRSITGELPEAVGTCVEAAGAELDVPRQAALLRAACYGRAFCPAGRFPRKSILETCRLLRLLNALRAPDVGMPMTMAQLRAQGPAAVLSRLVGSKRHLLALRIATTLDLNPEQVLVHWACAKITAASASPDAQLRDEIMAKLRGRPGIRFTDIAAHAQGAGRRGLAAMLLEHETIAAEQVPLLLRLGEDMRALDRATESGDTDLVYLVLFSMYRALDLQNFVAAISARPATRDLFLAYCSRTEPELLEQMCTTMGLYERVADLRVRESLRRTNDVGRLREGSGRRVNAVQIGEAIRLLERAASLYGQTKEHGFQAKAAAEFARLRKFQAELEDETGNACFVGLSVVGTAQQCLKLGNQRAAARVQSEFKISERRFWWLKVKSLAAVKDWDSLLIMAADKKPPVGVEALIGAVKAHGAPDNVTARFIAKLPDGKRKAEEYTAIKMYQEAAETAAHSKDSDMLSKIQGLVGISSPLGLAVTQIKDRLQTGTR